MLKHLIEIIFSTFVSDNPWVLWRKKKKCSYSRSLLWLRWTESSYSLLTHNLSGALIGWRDRQLLLSLFLVRVSWSDAGPTNVWTWISQHSSERGEEHKKSELFWHCSSGPVVRKTRHRAVRYSLGLTSTATSCGWLGTGGSGGMDTYVLPPTRYTVATTMTLH